MKNLTLTLFAFSLTFLSYGQCSLGSELSKDASKETIDCVAEYINSFNPAKKLKVLQIDLHNQENMAYLLAQTEDQEGDVWLYCIELLQEENDEWTYNSAKPMHGCQTDEFSFGPFVIEQGYITGCNNYNHVIGFKQKKP